MIGVVCFVAQWRVFADCFVDRTHTVTHGKKVRSVQESRVQQGPRRPQGRQEDGVTSVAQERVPREERQDRVESSGAP
jgi:hypothetical protein